MAEIFISYRRSYDDSVEELYRGLLHHGFAPDQIFRDSVSVRAGESWAELIYQTLREAKVVLVVIGRDWCPQPDERDWVTLELQAAQREDIALLPVILPDGDLASAPDWLGVFASQQMSVCEPPTRRELLRLVIALDELGVTPRTRVDPWEQVGLNRHLSFGEDASKMIEHLEASDLGADNSALPAAIVVGEQPGSGRSALLRELCDAITTPTSPVSVPTIEAWHVPLRSRCVDDVCPVLDDWLLSIARSISRQRPTAGLQKDLTTWWTRRSSFS